MSTNLFNFIRCEHNTFPPNCSFCLRAERDEAMADLDATCERYEAELSGLRADGTGTCYCDTVGETPCAYCRIKELEADLASMTEARDALQEVVGRLNGSLTNMRMVRGGLRQALEDARTYHADAGAEATARVAVLEKALRAWREVPDTGVVTVEQQRAEHLTRVALADSPTMTVAEVGVEMGKRIAENPDATIRTIWPTSSSGAETIEPAPEVQEELKCKTCGDHPKGVLVPNNPDIPLTERQVFHFEPCPSCKGGD